MERGVWLTTGDIPWRNTGVNALTVDFQTVVEDKQGRSRGSCLLAALQITALMIGIKRFPGGWGQATGGGYGVVGLFFSGLCSFPELTDFIVSCSQPGVVYLEECILCVKRRMDLISRGIGLEIMKHRHYFQHYKHYEDPINPFHMGKYLVFLCDSKDKGSCSLSADC
jgi:hypothetical protein